MDDKIIGVKEKVADIEVLVVKEKEVLKNINKLTAAVTESDLNEKKIMFLKIMKMIR